LDRTTDGPVPQRDSKKTGWIWCVSPAKKRTTGQNNRQGKKKKPKKQGKTGKPQNTRLKRGGGVGSGFFPLVPPPLRKSESREWERGRINRSFWGPSKELKKKPALSLLGNFFISPSVYRVPM